MMGLHLMWRGYCLNSTDMKLRLLWMIQNMSSSDPRFVLSNTKRRDWLKLFDSEPMKLWAA